MLVVFSPIFVVDTKIAFIYNFVAPLKECFFGKFAGFQYATLSKDKLHYKSFSIDISTF